MATLVLQTAGQALGASFGGPVGATLGRAAGALAGSLIDQAIFGSRRRVEGPRLSDLQLMTSSEGAALPRLWGTARLAGQVIWALPIEEEATVERQGGSKGRLGGGVETTRYSYHASFAVALCEGPVTRIGRVWADGKPFDLTTTQWRLHAGSEDQSPDSLILAHSGSDGAPAYRGVAYVVFERLALQQFGNRLPQLAFEVVRVHGSFAETIRSVNLIPGATEFGYEPARVLREAGWGENETENVHLAAGTSDWSASLDQLQAEASRLSHVNLVVAWYGSDLDAGRCKVMPGVERRNKETRPWRWQVNGLDRRQAHLISRVDGRPAFGGTPSDLSVSHALADLKRRGLAVTFYPFLLMDIPPGGAQPAYPWRGRITAQSADDVSAFFDNGYRRMILHYANLCAAAGGVELFLIGSELKGLTTSRTGRGIYPAVAALVRLAGDVAAILPNAKISYAADWSEYFGHHPDDGSGRSSLPSRSAVGVAGDPLCRHRLLYAALRLARRRTPCRQPSRRGTHLRPGLSRRQCGGRRRLRLVLQGRGRAGIADPHADHRRCLWQALGVPLQGSEVMVARAALRPHRRS